MITRPLDIASRLRPPPRNFDWLLYVNVGLLALFFMLFGSRFVLAPGVTVQLPALEGANAGAKPPTHVISVLGTGLILTSHGEIRLEALERWLGAQARTAREPLLLVRGDAQLPLSLMATITSAAKRAGFVEVVWAAHEPQAGSTSRR